MIKFDRIIDQIELLNSAVIVNNDVASKQEKRITELENSNAKSTVSECKEVQRLIPSAPPLVTMNDDTSLINKDDRQDTVKKHHGTSSPY